MKYLIINADDFGLNSNVNKGIILAREAGAITNATLMVKREGAGEAIEYALENPSFSVGLHIDIDEVLLGDKKGAERFEKNYLEKRVKDKDLLKRVEEEVREQIALFEKNGLTLSHIDSHHHLHALPEVFHIILKLIERQKISTMRVARNYDLVKYPSFTWDEAFYDRAISELNNMGTRGADNFLSFSQACTSEIIPQGITELMTHPGKGERWREEELDFLLSSRWKKVLHENEVKLISFKALAEIISVERN